MRIIAGHARGMNLFTPKTDLRPSMEMVRGSIFDSLHDFVVDAAVLDLFSGCGAIGLEALSRGAYSADLVEKDKIACATIERNITKTRLEGAQVHCMDVFSYLMRVAQPGAFDLIIADPPYAKQEGERDFTPELLNCRELHSALAEDGIFVLEYMPGQKLPPSDLWDCYKQKRFGATETAFLRRK